MMVAAQVIGRDPSLWYRTVQIDKGSADGVHVNDPVLGDSGLVGSISQVGSNYAVVTLVPAVGNPNQLVLQYLPRNAQIAVGQQVVTAGFRSGPLESLFPPGIPIGQVSNADLNNLLNNGQVQVTVGADLRHLDVVQVLTSPHAGSARASVP